MDLYGAGRESSLNRSRHSSHKAEKAAEIKGLKHLVSDFDTNLTPNFRKGMQNLVDL